jgi:hypothetical protein
MRNTQYPKYDVQASGTNSRNQGKARATRDETGAVVKGPTKPLASRIFRTLSTSSAIDRRPEARVPLRSTIMLP